jgi:hypothetical protein
MNKGFYDMLDRAIAAAGKHEKELLSMPGVITVGAGPRRRGGKLTGEAAIVITVRKKAEQPYGNLPTTLDDVPVDVIELGKPVEAPEIVAAQASAKKALDKIRQEWLDKPNVVGLGVGYKTAKGRRNSTALRSKST